MPLRTPDKGGNWGRSAGAFSLSGSWASGCASTAFATAAIPFNSGRVRDRNGRLAGRIDLTSGILDRALLDDTRPIHAARLTRMTDSRHGYPIAASIKPPRPSAERLNPVHLFGGGSIWFLSRAGWQSEGRNRFHCAVNFRNPPFCDLQDVRQRARPTLCLQGRAALLRRLRRERLGHSRHVRHAQ